MSKMFDIQKLDFVSVPDKYISSKDFGSGIGGNIEKHTHLSEDCVESVDINSFCNDLGIYEDETAEAALPLSIHQQEQQLSLPLHSHFGSVRDFYVDVVSRPFLSRGTDISKLNYIESACSEVIELEKEKPIIYPSASVEIFENYGNSFGWWNGEKINVPSFHLSNIDRSVQKLSTDAIIRLAGEKFIHSCSKTVDPLSLLSHPHASSFFGLSHEEAKDVELVQCLLASAEKVGQQQFDLASKLLNQCDYWSYNTGNPVQRLVYYFSEALREKIDRETGRITSKGLGKKQSFDLEEALMSPNPTVISYYLNVPFTQVSQFTGVQTVIDNVSGAKKVHIIDLEIRGGMKFTVLMQALAARRECPLEHLKITAIGTKSQQKIEETGKRLMNFAQSMNFSFSFNVVMVADMLYLNEDLFVMDADEAVAVYSPYILKSMITRLDRLECLMRVIKNINPCVMVVTEFEANNNSPVFVNRFTGAFFFYAAIFDSLEDCMYHDEQNRMIAESIYFSQAIRNVVAAEGDERTTRHVNIKVWRAFFARFGMVETGLSTSSLYQADLLLEKFTCGSSCTLDLDEKSLIIGWKGTPIYSLSAWKFLRQE